MTITSDPIRELFEMIEAAGLRVTLDFKRDITLCAICGKRSRWSPGGEAWTIRLPWLGSCRMACSSRCERIAIESRDAP